MSKIKMAVFMALLLISSFLAGCTETITLEEAKLEVENAVSAKEVVLNEAHEAEKVLLANKEALLLEEKKALELQNTELVAQLEEKEAVAEIVEAEVAEEAEEEAELELAVDEDSYVIDKMNINNATSNVVLLNRQLKTLYDVEIEFNDEDCYVKEVLTINGVKILNNGKDFEDNTYLSLDEKAIEYKIVLSALDVSEINENETLKLNFLGQEVEISKWDGDEITLTKGTEYFLSEGDEIEVDGKIVKIKALMDGFAYVSVDGEGEKIAENAMENVADLEIRVTEVIAPDYAGDNSFVTLKIGEDVEVSIENDKEYNDDKDSIWDYVVNSSSGEFGIVLNQDINELDEDFNALAVGESISLPNEYLSLSYEGLFDDKKAAYGFEIDDSYVEIDGDFLNVYDRYDIIYANASGFYENKGDLESIDIKTISLGDSDSELEILNNSLVIEDITLVFDISGKDINSTSFGSNKDYYLSDFGIVMEDPKDSCEGNEFKLIVPEEQAEGSIKIFN